VRSTFYCIAFTRFTASSLLIAASLMAGALPAVAQGRGGPVSVFVQESATSHFVDRLEAIGTLRANETVEITATVTDTVTGVYFSDGARVAKGDTLLTMADGEERALLEEENAAAEEARRQLNRAQSLVGQGTISRSVLDERRRAYETAVARRSALQSRLKDRVITAPFDGVVGLRRISVGALITPGDVITRIHDDSVMKLDFSVPSAYLSTLAPGIAIRASARALDGQVFEGEISSLDNEIDPVTRSLIVRAILANDHRILRPGLLMSVELLRNPRDAIVIPEAAIVPIARETYVYVAVEKDGQSIAERRRIKIGARRPGEVEVLEGLVVGEPVITRGALQLRPGQEIIVTATGKAGDTLEKLLGPDAHTKNLPETPAGG